MGGPHRSTLLSPEPAYKSVLGRLAQGLGERGGEGGGPPQRAAPRPLSSVAAALAPSEGAAAVPPRTSADGAAAATAPAAPQQQAQRAQQRRPPGPDPLLQLQLRERIEQAKAEIKQQLSPVFRVSQALLSAEGPEAAAAALDAAAAAGLAGDRGPGLLAPRPGSAAATAAAAAAESGAAGRGRLGGQQQRQPSGGSGSPFPAAGSAVRDNPLFEQLGSGSSSAEVGAADQSGAGPAACVPFVCLCTLSEWPNTCKAAGTPLRLRPSLNVPWLGCARRLARSGGGGRC